MMSWDRPFHSPLKDQVLALARKMLPAELVRTITPLEMLRFLAVEAFGSYWDDNPDRVHDCAVIRRGIAMCMEHGEIPLGADAVPELCAGS